MPRMGLRSEVFFQVGSFLPPAYPKNEGDEKILGAHLTEKTVASLRLRLVKFYFFGQVNYFFTCIAQERCRWFWIGIKVEGRGVCARLEG